ncbi:hypothetical protein WICPIJ_002099 [Wickerhamomyces pijperi]|uniref:ADF-H domain-containing protein n=1 Tax=Wickerhamomyces pijperi TaxID=599730 RepID=A0A9P8QAC6_WICPI|nr:hypothetical protein WICPIJ_002099 [Wickerhamomyces pijperi]
MVSTSSQFLMDITNNALLSNQIDQNTYEIKAQTTESITSVEDLVDELPDNTPRYIVLSYPLTLKDGRKASPLVMGYWLPPTCTQSARMLYAAAVELFRSKCGVSKLIEFEEEEDFEDLQEKVL